MCRGPENIFIKWKEQLKEEHTNKVRMNIFFFLILVPVLEFLYIKIPIPKYHEIAMNHRYLYVLEFSIQVHQQ